MTEAAFRALGSEAPPGRDEDYRDVLALLDGHPVVAVVGPRGNGKTALLHWVANRRGGRVRTGELPRGVSPGELVVVDEIDRKDGAAAGRLARQVVEAEGKLLIALRDATNAPSAALVYRLRCLAPHDAVEYLEASLAGVFDTEEIVSVVDRLGGQPLLLNSLVEVSRTAVGRAMAEVEARLASRLRVQWLEPLSPRVRRAAEVLALAGGWLPCTTRAEGFSSHVSVLAATGLAEIDDGAVIASPLLMAAAHDEPGDDVAEALLEDLRAQGRMERPGVRLAEAHLRHRLGDEEEALAALRDSCRFVRGRASDESYERGLLRLVTSEPSPLGDAAHLAWSLRRSYRRPRNCVEALVRALLARGALRSEERLEARTFLAYLGMNGEDPEASLAELGVIAEEAVSEGNEYAEAQALLWQTWFWCQGDDQRIAGRVAKRVVRLARSADAPVLLQRALYFLAQCDMAEGDFDAAERRLEQALRLCRKHRLDDDQTVALDALADLAARLGRPSEAAAHLAAAEAIIARAGNYPRKADVAVTRAEVALRRGRAAEAREILRTGVIALHPDPWRRDLVAAEVALAVGDLDATREGLQTMHRPPVLSKVWRRRRALLIAGLLEEGVDPGVGREDCLADPIAAICLERAGPFRAQALESVERIELELPEDDPEGWLLLRSESSRLRLLNGDIERGLSDLRDLRARLVKYGPPTSVLLFLEALEFFGRGEPLLAAKCAVAAHRSAMGLGHVNLAGYALECLVFAHLAEGRARWLPYLLARGERLAVQSASPARSARFAAYRVAAAMRFGGEPSREDVAAATSAGDPNVVEMTELLLSGATATDDIGDHAGGGSLAAWLRSVALSGMRPAEVARGASPATELWLDGERREAVLAGGKRVSFVRRRVLWRLIWKLVEADGEPIEPEVLYRSAWELPFNHSRLNSLYVGMRRLRLLVEPDPSAPRLIMAASTGGYSMDTRRVKATGPSPLDDG